MQAVTVQLPSNVSSLVMKKPYVKLHLAGPVNTAMMAAVIDKTGLLIASGQKNVLVEINSPGGDVAAGRRIGIELEAWKKNGITVITSVPTSAASMATYLLTEGSPGHRYIGGDARIMVHQASSGVGANSIEEQRAWLKNFEVINDELMRDMATNCGRPRNEYIDRCRNSHSTNQWLDSGTAINEWGLADKVGVPRLEVAAEIHSRVVNDAQTDLQVTNMSHPPNLPTKHARLSEQWPEDEAYARPDLMSVSAVKSRLRL